LYEVEENIDIIGPEEDKKSHSTALLLCFFFGAFGLHRIYTGYVLIGIIQFL
jgi:TM2 domain-containing membrane protein YozV